MTMCVLTKTVTKFIFTVDRFYRAICGHFTHRRNGGKAIIIIWVDDLIIAASDEKVF